MPIRSIAPVAALLVALAAQGAEAVTTAYALGDGGASLLRFSTDSPLRTTEGDLEAMALYAGQGTAFVSRKERAADVIGRIMAEAGAALDRVTGMVARRQELRP